MFEKPTAADITTGKKLTKAANATRDSLLIPSHTTNKGQPSVLTEAVRSLSVPAR
jgi:hypothetical protein